jgi:hypothetical protein
VEETVSDWEPRSLTPTNGDWESVDNLQVILQENPASISEAELEALRHHHNPEPVSTTHIALREGLGGFQSAPTAISLGGLSLATDGSMDVGLISSGKALDIQQGVVDFVRYFLPGGEFDPQSASPAFQLGEFLLDLFARFLTFPGGAILAYSVLTSLGREVPELGAYLNQQSDLSIFEAIDNHLGKLIRKLLGGFDAVSIATPSTLQRVEQWIHSVADNYRDLETSGIFDEPDFLGRLFQHASDHMDQSLYPGQKAGWVGVVFYAIGLVFEEIDPEIAKRLFESGDLFFHLSDMFNIGQDLRYLQNIGSTDDLFRILDDVPLGPLDTLLTVVDGAEGVFDYGQAISDLYDPSLNPYVVGDQVWPERISVMLSGIDGILSTGSAVVTLAGAEAIAAFAAPLAVAMIICFLIRWILDNRDWILGGMHAWGDSWEMLTRIVIPYRLSQGWQWFDDNLGRPLRENVLQPIGQWANNTWNGVTGLVQSLEGD